jgi:8-oxo-dGTP pyrophosphatase MutT (NUDIX family)
MNSALYGNVYRIPDKVIEFIQKQIYKYPSSEGIRRAKFLTNNKFITYQSLKRLKNFFDNFDPNENTKEQYDLSGGRMMQFFVDQTLETERQREKRSTTIKRDTGQQMNSSTLKAPEPLSKLAEGEEKNLKINAICIIFDKNMRILLVRRSPDSDWEPNKWGLVGGGVEEGEKPIEGVAREIEEEIGLEPKTLIEKFVIQRDKDNVEHIFVGKVEDGQVKIDHESRDFGWFTPEEIKNMDTVPNLLDYIRIAAEKYS